MPTLSALLIMLVAGQLVFGKRAPWVPGRLRQMSFERARFRAAVEKVRPWTERIDRLLKPRLRALTVWPFNRLGAKDSKIEGTGIGLTITKQLVELMNGRIGFESSLGKGSVFWIELPLAADEKPKRGAAKLAKVSGTGNAPKGVSDEHVVLYVEDDPASVKLMETIVGRLTNLVLISTDNAEAALLLAETRRPDIILMDIDLPGMNGIEAIEHLRANDKTRDIPVIALSADAMPEQINKAMEAGFLRYLTKPIKVDKLLDAIDAKPRNTAGAATGA